MSRATSSATNVSVMKPCDFCGQPEATLVADLFICDDCYIVRGSCCADDPDQAKDKDRGLLMDGQG
jgi:hypothetical protein